MSTQKKSRQGAVRPARKPRAVSGSASKKPGAGTSGKKSRSSVSGASLQRLRSKIDQIDDELLALLGERYRVVSEVQRAKQRQGGVVFQPERERAQLTRLRQRNEEAGRPLASEALEAIFREILSASRALQSPLSVAYLGPEGTFSESAARQQFGSAAKFLPVSAISEVFRTVERGEATFGVVPIENSTEGMVGPTLDALIQSPLQIVAERQLLIRHALLAKTRKRSAIKKVVSHPQSLGQCREWLATHLPGVSTREVSSNAQAASIAARSAGTAAIAGREAAQLYGLQVLADGIQDLPHNVTRFLVIASESAAPDRMSDKVSVIFSVKNEPGMLHRSLKPLAGHGIDLLKIESRPMRGRVWDYVFFVDLGGALEDPKVRRAMESMKRNCTWFKVLGSYPAAVVK